MEAFTHQDCEIYLIYKIPINEGHSDKLVRLSILDWCLKFARGSNRSYIRVNVQPVMDSTSLTHCDNAPE